MSQSRKNFSGQFYLLAIAGTALLFAISALPNSFSWLYFFVPLPVIYYVTILGLDRGLKIIAYAAVVAGLFSLATGGFKSLLYTFSLIPTGLMLAGSIKRREQVFRSGLGAVITLGITWLVLGVILSSTSQVNVYNAVLKNIDTSLTTAFDTYSKSPDFPVESKADLEAVFTRMRLLVPRIFPGSLVISAMFTVCINMLFANILLKRSKVTAWKEFRLWRLPEPLVWPLIGGILLAFIPNGFMPVLGVNIVLVLSALYFFQGLAVATHIGGKWPLPKPLKFLIFFVITIQAYGIILLALLGIADIWVDFRKPKPDQTK